MVWSWLLVFGSESPATAEFVLVSHQRLGVARRGLLALQLGKPAAQEASRVVRKLRVIARRSAASAVAPCGILKHPQRE